jgi:N-acetyl-anhydromuramyl-L-alanine amidase AmpD
MDFKAVAAAEAEFQATGKAPGKQFVLTPFSIPVPDEDIMLDGMTCRPKNGFTGYFYNQKYSKKKVVLHFTVGHLKGDLLSLTSESRGHVSTAFVVARDGMIYQLFSSAAWSYHLGRNAQGGNGNQSKISIGVEISNYGPLIKKGNELHTVYSKAADPRRSKDDVYCTLEDTEQYIKLSKKYRGYQYFANYTNEQYHAIIVLLRYLTNTYDIPRKFVDEANRFKTTRAGSADFEGITSHVNFRSDKFDIGPAFDWERVIAGVTADTYGGNPLEDAVKNAEKKVAEAQEAVEHANAALATAKAELEAAQNALEDSEVISRSASILGEEESVPVMASSRSAEAADDEYDDGPEPFDIDRSPFYEV